MKIEKKLAILLGVFVLFIVLTGYNFFYNQEVKTAQQDYFKVANDIAVIEFLDNLYKSKKENENNINALLERYKSKIVSKKLNKNNIEFKLDKLSSKEFDDFVNELVDNHYKILSFKANRVDGLNAQLECKVLF